MQMQKNISRGEIIKVQSMVWYLILYDHSQILQNDLFRKKTIDLCKFETYHHILILIVAVEYIAWIRYIPCYQTLLMLK